MRAAAFRIFVHDLDESRRFYSDVLGLSCVADDPDAGYLVYDAGVDVVVELCGDERELAGRFTGISFAVASVATEYDRLCAADVDFAFPPEEQPWGGWLAHLFDPSGNVITIVEYPTVPNQETPHE